MRKMWIKSLALSLGLVVTGARGQESVWRSSQGSPAGNPAPPAAGQAKPIAIATSKPAESQTTPAAPAVTLGRPRTIARTPVRDESVQPASFTPTRDPLAPVARGRAPDVVTPRPMPTGPTSEAASMPTPGYSLWRRADDVVASTVSRNGGESVAAPPVPGPGGTLLVPPTPIVPGPTLGSPPPGFGGAANGPMPAGPFPPIAMNGPPMYGKMAQPMPCPSCAPAMGAPSAGGAACGPWGGQDCCDAPRFTLGFETLHWWMKGDNTPPLVNGAPAPPTTLNSTAFTSVLSGDDAFASQVFNGARIRGQYWFSDRHCWGIDGSAVYLPEQQDKFFAQADGVTGQLGRPFLNLTPNVPPFGGQVAEVVAGVAGPQTNSGNVAVLHRTSLWGFDANLRRNLWCGEIWTFDAFFGYRQFGFQEDLTITENVFVTNNPANTPAIPVADRIGNQAGTTFTVRDQFSTSNRFYGGQVGFDTGLRFGDWTVGLRSSVALGCTQQTIDISGSTTRALPGAAAETRNGGLLALQDANIGRYTRKFFGVVPEVGLTLGWDCRDWLRMTCGYNFLYWNNVARSGEQIDNGINLSRLAFPPTGIAAGVGDRRPMPLLTSSDLFVHGVTFGFEFRY